MTRRDIEFSAEGTTLRGWFYTADDSVGARPTIVMAHGYSAVKEMYLDRYAEVFAAAGLNALVFDNRNFGASHGSIPARRSIRAADSRLPARHHLRHHLGRGRLQQHRLWGSSYSGGHMLVVSALDRRVKAVVSQGALVDGYQNLRRLVRPDFIEGFREQFDADRLARFNGEAPAMVPVVDADPHAPSALPTPDSYQWFTEGHETIAPSWRNEVTLRSVEMLGEYVPADYIAYISPTPLLLLPAVNDVLTPDRSGDRRLREGPRA